MEDKSKIPILKVGDKVIINSIDWYNTNKNGSGNIVIEGSDTYFIDKMKKYCGKVYTIKESFEEDGNICYYLKEIEFIWQSWMFSPAKESTEEKSKKRRSFFRREPQTGDTIRSHYFNGIIIGENDDKDAFMILTTPDFDKHWLDKDDITEIDCYGRYLYHIDTCELNLNARANKLKESLSSEDEVLSTHKAINSNKGNNSQSDSSEFDLSKVIYRSRRIK